MMTASPSDIIRRESLSELRQLASWFRVRHGLEITLLGGWAVFAYNAYVGSFDIDCLGPTDPFTLQLNIYMSANGYVLEGESPIGAASESWKKAVVENGNRIGEIYIDACDFQFPNRFKEDSSKLLPYSMCSMTKFIQRRPLGGEYFYVPVKELLVLYKAKAARDRDYVIRNESFASELLERYEGKRDKDYSDIVALLDPAYGAIDGSIIGEIVQQNDLLFITPTIRDLSELPGAESYCSTRGIERDEIKSWVDQVMQDSGL